MCCRTILSSPPPLYSCPTPPPSPPPDPMMDVDTNMNVSWEEPSLNTGLLASVPAALWIKDAMRSHWEMVFCGFTTAFYASLRWESSPSFAALASRLAQTECFCVPVGWSQSAVRGTLPGNLWFQPNAVSVVVPVWQQLSSSSCCGLNTSACPVLSAHWIRRESELTWWEKPF